MPRQLCFRPAILSSRLAVVLFVGPFFLFPFTLSAFAATPLSSLPVYRKSSLGMSAPSKPIGDTHFPIPPLPFPGWGKRQRYFAVCLPWMFDLVILTDMCCPRICALAFSLVANLMRTFGVSEPPGRALLSPTQARNLFLPCFF